MRSVDPHSLRRLAAVAIFAAACAAPAVAQTPAGKAVEARQAGFKQMGAAFKAVNDELRSGKPDAAKIAQASERLRGHAAQLPTWFPKGSGAEAGVKTGARPEIWSDAAGFADAASRLRTATTALHASAQAGDINVMRQRARAVGQACQACHTAYREED